MAHRPESRERILLVQHAQFRRDLDAANRGVSLAVPFHGEEPNLGIVEVEADRQPRLRIGGRGPERRRVRRLDGVVLQDLQELRSRILRLQIDYLERRQAPRRVEVLFTVPETATDDLVGSRRK